jgi:hypothetical protein
MDLVGAWLRQLLRAGTAAAIVPVALLAALVTVLISAGGFGGLTSLRQVVAGPEVSPTQTAAAGPDAPAVTRRPVAPAPRPAVRARAPRAAAPPPRATPPAPRPAAPAPPPPPAPPQRSPAPPAAPAPAPPPPPPPPEIVATPEKPALEQTTQALVDGVDGTLDTVGELLVALIKRLGLLLPPKQS